MNSKVHRIIQIQSHIDEDQLIDQALAVLERKFERNEVLKSPREVEKYLSFKLRQKDQEVFCCIYLDNKNQVVKYEELFVGTIDQVSVYPREVVTRCLQLNASAVIVAHNHPSGVCEPSKADERITEQLKESLALLDIRLLDHLIIGGANCVSMAERGYL